MRKLTLILEQRSIPSILQNNIVENLSNRDIEFRLFNSKLPTLALQSNFIYKQLLDSIRTQRKNVLLNNSQNATQIKAYLDSVQRFLDLLLALVHTTSGQLARGTELLSVYHKNLGNRELRNMFLYNRLVAIMLQYYKEYNVDKTVKIVYQFLLCPISSLLVQYLQLI